MIAAPLALAQRKNIPLGVQLFTLRNTLEKDVPGTLRQVAAIGYKNVEFYVPFYLTWTPEFARQVRKQMDDLGLRCTSTHNAMEAYLPEGIGKALELNQILGARYLISARRPKIEGIDGWKKVAEALQRGNERIRSNGLFAGYHSTTLEWTPVEGQRPMDVLLSNTDQTFAHQLDVGTCVAAGADPVEWVQRNPGRIRSLHLKDWAPDKAYGALFGEGTVPWQKLFAAAEDKGGAEFYVMEQEQSVEPPLEAIRKDLDLYEKLRRAQR